MWSGPLLLLETLNHCPKRHGDDDGDDDEGISSPLSLPIFFSIVEIKIMSCWEEKGGHLR